VLKSLAQSATGVDLEEDVVPLRGNPFVVGATDAKNFLGDSASDSFVAAIQVADEDKLGDLLEKTGVRKTGEKSGATIYDDEGTEFAVEGDSVVFAGTREQLDAALERADGDDKLDEETFESGLEGLPDSGIARVYANLAELLTSASGTEEARRIKWVSALESFGLTASVKDDGIEIEFVARTNGDELTEEDLPIASGDQAPAVVQTPGEIGVGVRDIGQIVKFVETVVQAISPSTYGDYAAAKKQLEERLDVDVEKDLLDQLSGDISASISLSGDFGVRTEPKDPAAFERTLAKVADVLPSLAEGAGLGPVAIEKPKGNEDFYALAQPDGEGVVFGVVDGVFVVASDADRAARLATTEPEAVDGAQGAVVLSADAEELANAFIEQLGSSLEIPPQLAAAFTKPLSDLTGSISADTDGVSGRIRLSVDE